ncbi:hypothetical protein ACKWTF_002359 [Chironomus riparius]
MEETERDKSPDLSESFEIYLEQKKKKIEIEKNKLDDQHINEREFKTINTPGEKKNFMNSSTRSVHNDLSCNDSFIELEKMCENTLNLNNISEVLADLTSIELKMESNDGDSKKIDHVEETKLQEMERPSFFLNNSSLVSNGEQSSFKNDYDNFSTVLEATTMSLSYKTTHSHCPSVMSSDKSEYYQTANDKSFELMKNISNEHSFELNKQHNESTSLIFEKKRNDQGFPPLNDTLDEIDFLLSQAQKLNDQNGMQNDILKKAQINDCKLQHSKSPILENRRRVVLTPKSSPLSSPLINFKHPKPVSSSKNPQFSRVNNKKFQHIVSPVSRYIQTSESVLNANAHLNYKGLGAKRQFNFRDSENFNQTHDISVKASSLPLRAKTNTLNSQKISEKEKQTTQNKFKMSPIIASKTKLVNLPRNATNFSDNTFNEQ